MHACADARTQIRRENADDDIEQNRDVTSRAAARRNELEEHAADQKGDDQAENQTDRPTGKLDWREPLDGALDGIEFVLEERLSERCEQHADDRPGDGRQDVERELPRFARKMQRDEMQIRLASQQKPGDREHDRKNEPQQRGCNARTYANVTKAAHTSFATNRPRRVSRAWVASRSSSPSDSYRSMTGA